MKKSFGCGVLLGIILALILCGGVYFFFYSRRDPEGAGRGIESVESGWTRVKSSGDKGLEFVKRNIPKAEKAPVAPAVPASGDLQKQGN